MPLTQTRDQLEKLIKQLSNSAWHQQVTGNDVTTWLNNFDSEQEKHLAIHLLSQFTFFGIEELRELLKTLYRDWITSPIIRTYRSQNPGKPDVDDINRYIRSEVEKTRFLGVGNPSESGTHLLYYFRQVNDLPKSLFISTVEIFRSATDQKNAPGCLSTPIRFSRQNRSRSIRNRSVTRYVFFDDLCGTGSQAILYSKEIVQEIRALQPTARVEYICLFASTKAIERVRDEAEFDVVGALYPLDPSYRCFEPESRYYFPDEHDARKEAKIVMTKHGDLLFPGHPLGYKDSQLLLGFAHNTPDNSLPVIWSTTNGWVPAFKRYHKHYDI